MEPITLTPLVISFFVVIGIIITIFLFFWWRFWCRFLAPPTRQCDRDHMKRVNYFWIGFAIGNILKYAQRYGRKGLPEDHRSDLMKVLHYAIIALSIHDEENKNAN